MNMTADIAITHDFGGPSQLNALAASQDVAAKCWTLPMA
jgi:hypothetical protein